MYNGGIRGKRAGDGFGTLSARDQFNQSVLQIPALTGWQPTDGSYNILTGQNAVAPGAIVVVYGTGFSSTATYTVYLGNVQIGSYTVVDTGRLAFTIPSAQSSGVYTLVIYSSTGGAAALVPGIQVSGFPTWTFTSYSQATIQSVSIQLQATGNAPLTYALQTPNTLPAGLSLSSTGLISGSLTVPLTTLTTYTVNVIVYDAANQPTTQTITITLIVNDTYFSNTTMVLTGEANNTPFIADASTNNFQLTLNGNPKPTYASPYYSDGYYSMSFNGSTDAYKYGNGFAIGSGAFTIECFFFLNNTAFSSFYPLLGTANQTNALNLRLTSATVVQLDNGVANQQFTVPTMIPGTWYHVAVTRNSSGTVTVFLNGTRSSTGAVASTLTLSVQTNFIGYHADSSSHYLPGLISNLRIVIGSNVYDPTLTTITVPTSPLTAIANTQFLVCQSQNYVDKSVNSFAMTANSGSPAISSATPFAAPTSVTVNTGYSVYFNGSTDYLSLASSSAFGYGTGNFTVECWVYPTGSFQTAAFIDNRSSGSDTVGFSFGFNNTSGQLNVYTNSSSVLTSSSNLSLNQWYHIAVSRTAGTMTMYINGVSVGSTTYTNSFGTSQPALIGRNVNTSPTNWFQGYISNMRVVNGTGLYTTNFTPSTTPLTAITNTTLLTCQGNAIIDASTNAATLTINGTPKVVNNTYPFTQTTSTVSNLSNLGTTYFNGSSDTINLPSSTVLPGSGNFTFEFWVNIPTAPTGGAYYTCFAYGSTGSVLRCFVYNNSGNYFGIWIGATQVINVASTAMIGQWAHIALVRNGTTLTAYINGLSVGTYSDSTNYNTGQLYIGSQAAANYLVGYISDFRVVVGSALYTNNFAPTYQPLAAVTNTSLLTLQYNGGSTNTAIADNSIFNNVITTVGNPSQGNFSPYSQNGWSNYFNGSTDYFSLSSSTLTLGTTSCTIEGWFYPISTSGSYNLICSNRTSAGTDGISLTVTSANKFAITTSGTLLYTSTTTINNNVWTHFAFVRTGSQSCSLYINGVLDGSFTDNRNFAGTGLLIAGGETGNNDWTGYISNLRILKNTALYTSNFTPSTTPLTTISNTAILTCQSNRFIDNSSSLLAITTSGAPSIQAFSPFQSMNVIPTYYSTYFGGSGNYLTITGASIPATQTTFTIECFIYMTQLPTSTTGNSSPLIGDFTTSSTSDYWAFGPIASGVLSFYWYDGAIKTVTGNTVMSINTWYHIALSVNSSSISLYVNGVAQTLTGTTTLTNRTGTLSSLYMGQFNSTTNIYYGYVSSLRILNTTALYSSSFAIPTTPLTAIATTLLLTCQTNKIVDLSTNSYAITSTGTIRVATINPFGSQYTITTPVAYNPSINGGSCYFNGTTDYLTISTVGNPLDWPSSANYTVEAWVYPTSFVGQAGILSRRVATSSTTDWSLYYTSSALVIYNYNGSTTITASSTLTLNAWNHTALSISGGTARLFLNGNLISTPTSISSSSTGQASTYVIGEQGSTSNMIAGYISDVRVTPNVAIYISNFAPPTSALTSAPTTISQPSTLLLNFNNGGITDAHSTNNLVGAGTAGLSTSIKKYGSSSLSFSGSSQYFYSPSNPLYAFGVGDFTIEAWIYLNALTNIQPVCQSDAVGSSTNDKWFFGYTSSTLVFNTHSSGGFTSSIPWSPSTGTWYYVTVVRQSGTMRLYVNGVAGTVTVTGTPSGYTLNQNGIAVGGMSTPYYLNGYIDDLRITKGYARYTGAFSVPASQVLTR